MIFLDLNKKKASIQKNDFVLTAGVVKLVDTPDLGSGVAKRVGSSPSARTIFFRWYLIKEWNI